MIELVQKLVWFFVAASAVAFAAFLIGGSVIHRNIVGDTRVVLARDSLRPGEHHLSGMVSVPSTCHQLSTKVEELSSTLFHVRFSTWREPHVQCVEEDTPRAFRAIVFAPAVGIDFVATLDDAPLDFAVLPAVSYSSIK